MLSRFIPNDPELHPYRHGLYFAFFNALNWQVAIGTPTVLFMQQLGANSFQIGLVFAFTFLLTPMQVIATAWLPRFGFKQLTILGWNPRAIILLVPLGISFLAPNQPVTWMILSMVVAMFLYSLNRAVGNVAITPWLYQIVPAKISGRYWATDQMLGAGAGLGILVLCSALFAVLPPYAAYQVQYLIAILGVLAAYRELRQLPDGDKPKLISLEKICTETPHIISKPGTFRTYLIQSVALFLAITPLSPFTVYYLRMAHATSAATIMLLAMLTYLGVITANMMMRSRLDKIGVRPFFRKAYLGYSLVALGWLVFVWSNGHAKLLLPLLFFAQGFAGGAWTSANINYLAQIIPPEDRALPVSIHSATITFLGGITPVVWGLFLKNPQSTQPVNEPVLIAFFALLLVVMVVLALVLRFLPDHEHPVVPLQQGAAVLRPLRGAAGLINLVLPHKRHAHHHHHAHPDEKATAATDKEKKG